MPVAIPLAIAGGAVASSVISSNAAGNAADAQKSAANNANATQLQMYNQTRTDQTPWRDAGGQAVDALSQWYGLGGTSTSQGTPATPAQSIQLPGGLGGGVGRSITIPGNPGTPATPQAPVDYNKILSNMPGYQFQMQQGDQAVQRNLAARGLLDSGAAGKALTQYGQGLAGSYADKYVNGLQSLAGLGQTSVQSTGAAGANAANQIGSGFAYGGNAAASGYVGQANAINSGLSGLVGAYGNYQQQPPQTPPPALWNSGNHDMYSGYGLN